MLRLKQKKPHPLSLLSTCCSLSMKSANTPTTKWLFVHLKRSRIICGLSFSSQNPMSRPYSFLWYVDNHLRSLGHVVNKFLSCRAFLQYAIRLTHLSHDLHLVYSGSSSTSSNSTSRIRQSTPLKMHKTNHTARSLQVAARLKRRKLFVGASLYSRLYGVHTAVKRFLQQAYSAT